MPMFSIRDCMNRLYESSISNRKTIDGLVIAIRKRLKCHNYIRLHTKKKSEIFQNTVDQSSSGLKKH